MRQKCTKKNITRRKERTISSTEISFFLCPPLNTSSKYSTCGFTFFELMAVITILVILLALSVGTLSRISSGYSFEASVSEVDAVIRRARNFAVQRQSASTIHLNPKENTIFAIGETVVAQWHLEEETSGTTYGAFGLTATEFNTVATKGKFGNGREFGTTAGLNVRDSYIDCGDSPTFTPPTGIVISAWIFPGDFKGDLFKSLVGSQSSSSSSSTKKNEEITLKEKYLNEYRFTIVAKGSSYFLRLTEEYALEFGFLPDRDYYPLRTLDRVITPNRWNHITLRYSSAMKKPQDRLKVSVDGIGVSIFFIEAVGNWKIKPLSSLPGEHIKNMLPDRLEVCSEHLTISSKEESFFGKIDEICISAVIEPEVHNLKGAYIMGFPQIIYFDRQGRLDSEYHNSAVSFSLTENSAYIPPEEEDEDDMFVSKGGGIDEPLSLNEVREQEKQQKLRTEKIATNFKQATVTISPVGTSRIDFFRESQ